MATAVTMPRLGLNMVEGTVTEWKAAPGEAVARGQVVAVIESDKAEAEVEAADAGVLRAVYVEVGQTVPIGALLGAIAGAEEAFDAAAFSAAFVPETAGAPAMAGGGAAPAAGAQPAPAAPRDDSTVKAAPAARALARRLGIDLASIAGSGPGGRILPEDVERAASAGPAHEVSGSGPAILLVNGFAVDASGWRRQKDELSSDHTVVTFDHRGIGASPPLGAEVTIESLADDAAALVRSLERGPVAVVGASMGAAVALEMAIRHAEVVRALVLVTPVFVPDPRVEAVLRSWTEGTDPAAEGRIRGMLPWLLSRGFLAEAGRREAAAAALRSMAARTPLAALRRHLTALLAWLGARHEGLASLRTPCLVLAGGGDLLATPEHAQALVAAVPGAKLEVVAEVGHALMIERPAELDRRIRELVSG